MPESNKILFLLKKPLKPAGLRAWFLGLKNHADGLNGKYF